MKKLIPLLLIAGCAHALHPSKYWGDVLSATAWSYEQEGRDCVKNTKTREAAELCMAEVAKRYEPVFRAVETVSDMENAFVAFCLKAKENKVVLPKEAQEFCEIGR